MEFLFSSKTYQMSYKVMELWHSYILNIIDKKLNHFNHSSGVQKSGGHSQKLSFLWFKSRSGERHSAPG